MYVLIALAALAAAMIFNLTGGALLQTGYGIGGVAASEACFALIALAGGTAMVLYAKRQCAKGRTGEAPVCEIADIFAFRLPRFRALAGGVLLAVGGFFSAALYSTAAQALFPEQFNEVSQGLSQVLADPDLGAMLAGSALMPALCEELLFRGMTQYAFSRDGHTALGAVVTAVLFGVYHLSPIRIPLMAMTGLLLCYALVRSGSIFVPMLMHFVNNAVSVLLATAAENAGALAEAAEASAGAGDTAVSGVIVLAVQALIFLAAGAALLEERPGEALRKYPVAAAAAVAVVAGLAAVAALA